jgi:Flp pilus assembly protein TadG
MRKRPYDQDGSLTVELVVMTPVLFLLVLCVLAFGRISEARQEVVEAARAGAESAAVQPNSSSAQWGAALTASVGVSDGVDPCRNAQVVTDVTHFYPGGYVSVTVDCHVDLSDLPIPGFPSGTVVRATSIAPIDPYRSVQ